MAPVDLYILRHQPPTNRRYCEITEEARRLSQALVRQEEISTYIRRIAWLRVDQRAGSLKISKDASFARPKNTKLARRNIEPEG